MSDEKKFQLGSLVYNRDGLYCQDGAAFTVGNFHVTFTRNVSENADTGARFEICQSLIIVSLKAVIMAIKVRMHASHDIYIYIHIYRLRCEGCVVTL